MKKQGFAPQSKNFFFLSQSFKAVLVIHLFNFDADPGFVAKLKSGSSTVYTNMNPDPVQCTRIWIRIQYSVHKYESGPRPVDTNMNPDPVQFTRIWSLTISLTKKRSKMWKPELIFNEVSMVLVDTKIVCFERNMFYFSFFDICFVTLNPDPRNCIVLLIRGFYPL